MSSPRGLCSEIWPCPQHDVSIETRMSCCQKKSHFCPCSSSWVRFWLCSCALANSEDLVVINCSQGEMLYEKLRSSPVFFISIPLSPHAGLVSLEILKHHASKAPCAKKGFSEINISNATGHWNYGLQALKMTICDWYVVSTERTYSSPLSLRQHNPLYAQIGGALEADVPGGQGHWKHGAGE